MVSEKVDVVKQYKYNQKSFHKHKTRSQQKSTKRNGDTRPRKSPQDQKHPCTTCGTMHAWKSGLAFGKVCHNCKGRNHFAKKFVEKFMSCMMKDKQIMMTILVQVNLKRNNLLVQSKQAQRMNGILK